MKSRELSCDLSSSNLAAVLLLLLLLLLVGFYSAKQVKLGAKQFFARQ